MAVASPRKGAAQHATMLVQRLTRNWVPSNKDLEELLKTSLGKLLNDPLKKIKKEQMTSKLPSRSG